MKLPRVRLSFHRRASFLVSAWGLDRHHSIPLGLYKSWTLYLGRVFIKFVYDRR